MYNPIQHPPSIQINLQQQQHLQQIQQQQHQQHQQHQQQNTSQPGSIRVLPQQPQTPPDTFFDIKLKVFENPNNLTEEFIGNLLEECKTIIAESDKNTLQGQKEKLFLSVQTIRNVNVKLIYTSGNTLPFQTLQQRFQLFKSINQFYIQNLMYFQKWKELIVYSIYVAQNSYMMPEIIQKDYYQEGFNLMSYILKYIGKEFPHYLILKDIMASHPTSLEFQNILDPLFKRATNLNLLLCVSGFANTARLVGSTFYLNQDITIQASYGNQLTDFPPRLTNNKPLNNRYSIIVQHLLSQDYNLEGIKEFLFPHINSQTLKAKIINLVTDALVQKTLQLLNKYDNNPLPQQQGIPFIQTPAWKEWVLFTDQFFLLVESQLVDYEQFILTLAEKKMKNGQSIRDNIVILLIAKPTIINDAKLVMVNDIKKQIDNNIGFLLPAVLSFYNETQFNDNKLNIFNHSLILYLLRTQTAVPAMDDLQYKKLSDKFQWNEYVQTINTWWKSERSRLIEISNNTDEIITLSIWSNFTTTDIETEWNRTQLLSPVPNGHKYYFPSGLEVIGRIRPLSILFLSNLSLRCRKTMLLESIKNLDKQDSVISPAFLEDYCLLLHITPSLNTNLFGLLKLEKPLLFHAILEIISNRLFKILKNNKEIVGLYKMVSELTNTGKIMQIKNHQLSRSYDFMTQKIIQYASTDIFKESLKNLNFGNQIANRRIIPTMARLIKTKGMLDFQKINNLQNIIDQVCKQQPTYHYSATCIEYFPEMIKTDLQNRYNLTPLSTTKTSILQKVQLENNQKLQVFQNLVKNPASILSGGWSGMGYNETNTHLIYCQLLLLAYDNKVDQILLAVQPLVFGNQLQQMAINRLSITMVDFLIDEALPFYIAQNGQQEQVVKRFGEVLIQFMFVCKLSPISTILTMLTDRDDSAYSFQLLDYILLMSPEVNERLNVFNGIQRTDPDFFIKNTEFNDTYNDLIPTLGNRQLVQGQDVLPIYYSNSVTRLLPIIDLLLCKLIESNGSYDLFQRVISQYKQLYNSYHDEPITQTREVLVYYHESPFWNSNKSQFSNPRIELLKLIPFDSNMDSYSSLPKLLTNSTLLETQTFNLKEYFQNLIHPLQALCDLSNPTATLDSLYLSLDKHIDHEFPNSIEERFNLVLIELLLNGLTDEEIVQQLIQYLSIPSLDHQLQFGSDSMKYSPPTSSMILVTSNLLALLPTSHQILLHQILQELIKREFEKITPNALPGSNSHQIIIHYQQIFSNYATNYQEKMANPTQVIMNLTQQYYLYCPLDKLLSMISLIESIKPNITTIYQFYILLMIVSPIIPRFSNTPHLCRVIQELLSVVVSLDKVIDFTLTSQEQSNVLFTSLSATEEELDFFLPTQQNQDNDRMNVDENPQVSQNANNVYWLNESIKMDLSLLDSITDWIFHLKACYKASYTPLSEVIMSNINQFNYKFKSNFKCL
ncbi:putative mediator complex subunit 23 [Tieghemostelium lacteum]|uniref:Putative mediator complex subunit 23 n=1 Tax=Tieghemostelium lacteum TaxID=361077 RepID=A0A152A399_TIELA|nr:putative mediator complex subunit 23 [Tieghemostelium lacteum]|eukprot:KYR00742.1 putative mediator complex subunit 23 [Tieghemostelium lacteum]